MKRRNCGAAALIVATLAACSSTSADNATPSSTVAPTSAVATTIDAPDGSSESSDASSTVAPTVTTVVEPVVTDPPAGPPVDLDRGTIPADVGGEVLGPLGSTEVDTTTDEGRVQIGTGDIPAGAADLPIPDGFSVDLASETTTDLGFSGTTTLPLDEVVAFYRTTLPEAGFAVSGGAASEGRFQVLVVDDGEWSGEVLLTTTPGTSDTTVTVALQTD